MRHSNEHKLDVAGDAIWVDSTRFQLLDAGHRGVHLEFSTSLAHDRVTLCNPTAFRVHCNRGCPPPVVKNDSVRVLVFRVERERGSIVPHFRRRSLHHFVRVAGGFAGLHACHHRHGPNVVVARAAFRFNGHFRIIGSSARHFQLLGDDRLFGVAEIRRGTCKHGIYFDTLQRVVERNLWRWQFGLGIERPRKVGLF